jgi:DNA-binding transcriptional MerR regulator
MSDDQSVERLSVVEAAEALGVTRDAIHKRIRRGSIEHEQGDDGRFYVYVDTSTTGAEKSTDMSVDDRTDILIAELQDRVRSLEEANRENRRIIAALTQRIPAIEAPPEPPSEARESPETAAAPVQRETPLDEEERTPEDLGTPGSGTARGAWWRRMFGG